ncbi:hypothetical protein H7J93_26365 [Mycobacterium barrassiae]|uniref:hypothetical protein n=1 Tax=Mycobacterium barrassiae TaxID=319709 RepID=UPI002265E9B6|nr:hypothetical protein [Mycobacterium barrassiae]MCV7303154.1 hypothetical protein [Mycobacterium barrassiae]
MTDHRQHTRLKSMSAAAVAALICVAVAGCQPTGNQPATGFPSLPASTTSSAQAAPTTSQADDADGKDVDYSRLLLQPGDLSDTEDTFAVRSTSTDPGGFPGASALFVNEEDTRAIADTVVIYPDAATASTTLREALPGIDKVVAGATPKPAPVGTDGTMAVGTSADGTKSATLLLFTQGPALVRLEFQSALGDATTDDFVIQVGKMQQIALRTGLPQPQ